jgi:Peptidase S46
MLYLRSSNQTHTTTVNPYFYNMKITALLKRTAATLLLMLFLLPLRADEGMWLPLLLEQMNITDMKARGYKLSAADIYSVNNTSMKDAVAQFGGGCTSELISGEGLLLTNHHCGYGQIQYHSSVEKDYLTNGFWAMNRSEELPCPGLTAMFIIRMEDVTKQILDGVSSNLPEAKRAVVIRENIKKIEKENTKDGYEAMVRGFFYGNVYYMFITETFTDVRMVGAPPTAIGNFGGDTDNWMWPRHTGDFSLFRIYANKNNRPAEYSKDNVPFKPRKFFPISMRGAQENDFTLVYGFPGRTTEYISSYAVSMIADVSDPLKVDLRTKRLDIIRAGMRQDNVVRIQYAAKYNGIANAWKKWQGEMKGLRDNKAVEKKQNYEAEFMRRVTADPQLTSKYGTVLAELQTQHTGLKPWQIAFDYFTEGVLTVEMLRMANSYKKLVELSKTPVPDTAEIRKALDALKKNIPAFYKNFNAGVDQKLAVSMFAAMDKGMDPEKRPAVWGSINKNFGSYFKKLYKKSMFSNAAKLTALVNSYKPSAYKTIEKDPAYKLAVQLFDHFAIKIQPEYNKYNDEIGRLNRTYMQAQMDVFTDRRFYPDANSTLRVSYGKVEGYSTPEGKNYNWFTTLDELIAKESDTIADYKVPQKLKDLHAKKDYGRYAAKDGKIHTCFIASNHTTGGNSGSPVIDAQGNLIGTNFDRCWEGTMSDVNYDPSICRNITLDIRYTLFIIDKYAGAGYLIDEMVLVK